MVSVFVHRIIISKQMQHEHDDTNQHLTGGENEFSQE